MTSILVVTERYWPDGNGGELATHLIVDVVRKRFNVIVVTGTENPSRVPGVKYIYEPLLSKKEKPVLWTNTTRLVNTQKFQKLLHENNVVYIPHFAFPIIPHAKRLGKKAVVHLHGYILISYTATILASYKEHEHRITLDNIRLECMKGFKHCAGVSLLWWLPKLARKWISQADKIICVSRRQAEIIADQAPELRDKVEVVYNPLPPEIINAELRKEPDDVPTFMYVGGGSYIKGFHILLQALNRLGKQRIKAKFIFAGAYNQQSIKILKSIDNKYDLDIQLIGKVENKKIHELHRETWALIFPSITEEPLPYAITEAMALGTIPIASKVGGVPEIIRDTLAENFLFVPGSVDELINRIEMVITQSREEITNIGIRLKEHATKLFNSKEISSRILKVFNSD